jgi:hypothetical protein
MRAFYPICIPTRTLYPRKRLFERATDLWLSNSDAACVVVCDRIFAYNLLQREPNKTWISHLTIARRRGANLATMALKSVQHHQIEKKVRVATWDEVGRNRNFFIVRRRIRQLIHNDIAFAKIMKNFVQQYVRGFTAWERGQAEFYEYLYLTNEVALSIFMTEIQGFCTEIWEPHEEAERDPLSWLYEFRADIVASIADAKTLCRKQITIPWP